MPGSATSTPASPTCSLRPSSRISGPRFSTAWCGATACSPAWPRGGRDRSPSPELHGPGIARAAPARKLARCEPSGSKNGCAALNGPSRFCHMPCAVEEAVAISLAGRGVLLERVERLCFVEPHLLAVVPHDDCHVRGRLGIVRGHQRRPVFGTGTVAGRFAAGILVERVKRHALG